MKESIPQWLVVSLLILFAAGCYPNVDWEHNVMREGIHFERIGQRESGTIVGKIARDTEIQGYPVKKGWVHFVSEFKLLGFVASQPIKNGATVIPAGSYIRLNDQGRVAVCALPSTMEIQGHLCKGTGGAKGVQTSFYPGGELHRFFAPKAVDIDGIPCKGGVFQYLQLHSNGKLEQCTLTRTVTISGIAYRAGTRMHFDSKGRVIHAK